jgi:hypothetical protein
MQVPPSPADAPVDAEAIARENADLRAQLLAENERLRAALAESQASGLVAKGLTDEDVRRLEHPEEFTVSNDELHAMIKELQAQFASSLSPSTSSSASETSEMTATSSAGGESSVAAGGSQSDR